MDERPSIDSTAVNLNELPDMARRLIELIGLGNTVKLVELWGGTTFPVAAGQRELGRLRYEMLAGAVGVRAADTLTTEYGRTRLYIPQCRKALLLARNRAICAEFDRMIAPGSEISGNDAVFHLARKYRISDRMVWRILKNTDMSPTADRNDQVSLFASCDFSR